MEFQADFRISSPTVFGQPRTSDVSPEAKFGNVQTIHGKDGRAGKDGESAYKIAIRNGFEGSEDDWLKSLRGKTGDKGDPFTYEDFTQEQLDRLKGKDGYTPVKGKDYFDGKDGKPPVKGTDYWTPTDKAEIVNAVISALPKYDGEVVAV